MIPWRIWSFVAQDTMHPHIYFADSDRRLNDEVIQSGYAYYWDGRSPKTPGFSRMIREVADQTLGRCRRGLAYTVNSIHGSLIYADLLLSER
jgi:hypothetical protein